MFDAFSPDFNFTLFKDGQSVGTKNKFVRYPYIYSEFALGSVGVVGSDKTSIETYTCKVQVLNGPTYTTSTDVMIIYGKIFF